MFAPFVMSGACRALGQARVGPVFGASDSGDYGSTGVVRGSMRLTSYRLSIASVSAKAWARSRFACGLVLACWRMRSSSA